MYIELKKIITPSLLLGSYKFLQKKKKNESELSNKIQVWLYSVVEISEKIKINS